MRPAAGGTIALAMLVCACVFAALAGPAVSLRLRTEALQQALSRLGPLGTAIQVSASWNMFTEAYTGQPVLTEALPALVSPALDLSVFTGPGASVTYRPDLAALGVPCLVILALMGVALVTETSRSRRRGVTGLLRVQ